MSENKDIYTILLDIQRSIGKIEGAMIEMHKKQDYTNGRVNKLESEQETLLKNQNNLAKTQEAIKTKIGIYAGGVGLLVSTIIAIVTKKLGL